MPVRFRQYTIVLVCSATAALLLYASALTLPLYMDDVVFGRYIESVSALELFTRLDSVPYYRPLSNLPWKLSILATGGFPPALLHLMNVVVHSINGALVSILAFRLFRTAKGNPALPVPVIAALFYITFPFSYQAVSWSAALGHLMAAMGSLIAIIALLSSPPGQLVRRVTLAWIALGSAIAVFSHENGVAVPLLVVGFSVFRHLEHGGSLRTFHQDGKLLPAVPALSVTLVYVVIWFAIPKARPDGISVSPADWIANLAYFIQGLGYPVAQFGAWVWKTFGLPREAVGAALGVGGVAAALGLAGWKGVPGLLWYLLAVSVPTLLLQSAYAIDGPRLMMTASPGAALLWTAAMVGLQRRWSGKSGVRRLARVAAFGAAGAILISSAVFIAGRMSLHERMSTLYRGLFSAAAADPDAMVVNLPSWLAFRDEWYALGSEGVTYMTNYIDINDLVYVNTGVRPRLAIHTAEGALPAQNLFWWGIQPGAPGEDLAAVLRQRGAGYVFSTAGESWLWDSLRRLDTQGNAATSDSFANGVSLVLTSQRVSVRLVEVTLDWHLNSSVSVTVFVHGVCQEQLIAQSDGTSLRSLIRFQDLPVEEVWQDVRWLALPDRDGCKVRAGLYDPLTGERVQLQAGGEWVEHLIE